MKLQPEGRLNHILLGNLSSIELVNNFKVSNGLDLHKLYTYIHTAILFLPISVDTPSFDKLGKAV